MTKEINDKCGCEIIGKHCEALHPDLVNETKEKLPDIDDIFDLADFFKVMGDSTRLQILIALIEGEFCVSDLSCMLAMSHSAVSHQLKALKNANLVKSRRAGRVMYYSLDDDHVNDILNQSLIHIKHSHN